MKMLPQKAEERATEDGRASSERRECAKNFARFAKKVLDEEEASQEPTFSVEDAENTLAPSIMQNLMHTRNLANLLMLPKKVVELMC